MKKFITVFIGFVLILSGCSVVDNVWPKAEFSPPDLVMGTWSGVIDEGDNKGKSVKYTFKSDDIILHDTTDLYLSEEYRGATVNETKSDKIYRFSIYYDGRIAGTFTFEKSGDQLNFSLVDIESEKNNIKDITLTKQR